MKTSLVIIIISFIIPIAGCKHEPVKKDKTPAYDETALKPLDSQDSGLKEKSDPDKKKGADLPDIEFEDLTVVKKKSDWISPVNIDYSIFEKGAKPRLVVQNSHSDRINDLAVSPDGRIIVTASSDKKIKIWSIQGILLNTLSVPGDRIYRIIITPDGGRIAAAMKNLLMVWRIDGKLLNSFKGKEYDIRDISISSDGKKAVSCSGKEYFDIRDSSFRLIKKIKTGSDIDRAAVSPDGKFIATGGSYYRTKEGWESYSTLWNGSGEFIRHLDTNKRGIDSRTGEREKFKPIGDIKWIIFSPDSRLVATTGEKHLINIRKTGGELVNSIKFVFVNSCIFSHDSKELIASGSHDIKVFELNGRERLSIYMRSGEERGNVVSCFGMTPDGEKFITGFSSPVTGLVRIWDRRGAMLKTLGSMSREFQRVLLDPGYRHIILEPDRRKSISFIWKLNDNSITEIDERVGFYRDGTEYRYYYGRYNVFNIRGSRGTGKIKTQYGGGVLPLADGRIAKWSSGEIVLQDLRGNLFKKILYKHYSTSGIGGPFPYGTEFSPDGKYFIIESNTSHGGRHYISLIDMNGKLILMINVETNLSTAAISSEGDYIATGHKRGLIQVWSRNGKGVRKFEGIDVEVNGLFFSEGSRFLASVSKDRIIRIWNMKTGRHISLQLFNDSQWVLYDEDMNYDVSGSGGKYITFIMGLTQYAGPSVEKKHYRRGLLKRFYR